MIESLALLMPKAYHIYVIALDRIDIEPQLKEFKPFGIDSIIITKKGDKKNRTRIIDAAKNNAALGYEIIIHYDEGDYGSESDRNIDRFIKELEGFIPNCKIITYSATGEEILFSNKEYHLVHYKPSSLNNGASWFLKEDLVYDAEPFIVDDLCTLSTQAKKCLDDFLDSDNKKPISILRLSYKMGKESIFNIAEHDDRLRKSINDYIGSQNKINVEFFGQSTGKEFEWFFKETLSDGSKGKFGSWAQYKGTKTLIVINSTCSRGTQVGFHPWINFWHDYRKPGKPNNKKSTTYGTYVQAIGRVFHYISDYNNVSEFDNLNTKIKVYADKHLFQTMEQVYATSNVEEMKKVWSEYSARKIGSRVVMAQKSKNHKVMSFIGLLDDDAEEIIKGWQEQIKSDTGKNPSHGVGSASDNKEDICKRIIKYSLAKGRHPAMYKIERSFLDNVHGKNTPEKEDSFLKFKNTNFRVVKLGKNLLDFYLSQDKKEKEIESLTKVYQKSDTINLEDFLETNSEDMLGENLLDKTLHPLVNYTAVLQSFKSKNSGHNDW